MTDGQGPRRIAVTGASGLVGTALCDHLTDRGDQVVRLVRRAAETPDEIAWDPSAHELSPDSLAGVDVVVNLAGAGIGDRRWTPSYKREVLRSRVDSTSTLVEAMLRCDDGPRHLVSGSAVGIYGSRGDADITEEDDGPDGAQGFAAEVVRAWEAATVPAREAGIPVARARTGTMVLAPHGGAMTRILRVARLGIFGPMGLGRQWWSWITLPDEVRALTHLVDHPEITGPVNLTTPNPSRQRDVATELGRRLHRPSVVPAPTPALYAVLGEFAGEVLASQRILPVRLLESGFEFEHPTLEAAMDWLVGEL
jgi:uncharacterized protein (TIGR01777 family)